MPRHSEVSDATQLSDISDAIKWAGEVRRRKLGRIKKITHQFVRVDNLLMDIQEELCAKKLTHRADQVDILRRALNVVLTETHGEVQR